MRVFRQIIFIILVSSAMFSCRIANKLPENERIYGGAKVRINVPDSLKTENLVDLNYQLTEFTRPIENTGLPLLGKYKVWVYYTFGESKSKKGIKEWFTRNFTEKPVFINQKSLVKNEENLVELLRTKGYFKSKVVGKLTIKGYQAFANYEVNLNERLKIDTVEFLSDSSVFQKDFYAAAKTINLGKYFDLQNIKAARLKIETDLRQNGYYNFTPDYVGIWADTTQKKGFVSIKIGPAQNLPIKAIKQYQINDIFVNIDSKVEQAPEQDLESLDFFRGLILEDEKQKFKESVFSDAIAFRPGTFYNSQLQDITNNRLQGLNNFKSIRSSFEIVNRLDSTLIDVHYFLHTQKRKSLRVEANAISRSSGLAGSQLSFNWQNSNVFKGAEFLKITLNGGLELQVGGKKSTEYNDNFRVGGEAVLSFPRFIAPFIKIDPEISKVLPKTQINVGYESFIKRGLYNLNSARVSLGYLWTRGRGIEHALKPFNFNLVKSTNISTVFIDEIFADPRLLSILENQFIAGGTYEININQRKTPHGTFSYRGALDLVGNTFGLYDKLRNSTTKQGKVFGETFSQFIRLENDIRFRKDITPKLVWANRSILGLGVPLGNSQSLPFINQFYVGGNNSIRAFRARGVGPGNYEKTNKAVDQFLGSNVGDIKLEFNTELRYKVSNFINTAFFIDAGNVWMYKDQSFYDEGALISKNFYKELAVGTGIGLRLDFSFIIFRLDLAAPIKKPWLPEKNRWVINQWAPGNKAWRKENLILNIGVGLPF
jgi:outer membrane protein assembly factor BamA